MTTSSSLQTRCKGRIPLRTWPRTLKHRVRAKAGILMMAVVVMALAMNTVSAQSIGKISGKVTDEATGEALVGCNVLIVGTQLGAATDIDGTYFILNVEPGKYDIQASYLGYQKVLQRDVIVNSARTTIVDFKLKSSALLQQEVVVEAIRPDVEPDKTSTSTIIRTEDVGQIAGMRDIGDVIGLAADVTDGHFRGGRSDEEYLCSRAWVSSILWMRQLPSNPS